MSDEDRDVDIESEDEDEDCRTASSLLQGKGDYMTPAEKRAHHNLLERKRRDHIKDSFTNLRKSVPTLTGDKASRALILKSATEYIQYMSKKNAAVQSSIEDLKKENKHLDLQVRALDRAKTAGLYAQHSSNISMTDTLGSSIQDQSDSEQSEDEPAVSARKKLKT